MARRSAQTSALETLIGPALESAAQALADVAGDATAPHAARVQAATTILRVAGLLDREHSPDADNPLANASDAQLMAALDAARAASTDPDLP